VVPLLAALAAGLVVHAVNQSLSLRAGPVPILLAASVVGVLVSLRARPATSLPRAAALLCWGVLAAGLGVLGVYLWVVGYWLPRPLTGAEAVAFDLAMFCWFVAAAAVTAALAARSGGRRGGLLLLATPVVQAAFGPVSTAVVEIVVAVAG
jgi:hypothetical protein